MKINIIGPSASGKSWLANELSKQTITQIYSTDKILNRFSNRGRINEAAFEQEIMKIISQKNWILEGKYFSKLVFERADFIVLTERGLVERLFRQWCRFLTDVQQRENYGLIRNLKMSANIFRQQFGLYSKRKLKSKRVYSKSKVFVMTKGFKDKFRVVRKMGNLKNLLTEV